MFGAKFISPITAEEPFHIDTVQGTINLHNPQPDVIVTVGNKSFYFEMYEGKVVLRVYDLHNDIPENDEGTVIYTGEVK